MRKIAAFAALGLLALGCSKKNDDTPAVEGSNVVYLEGHMATRTLAPDADSMYVLRGTVFVDSTQTLTIMPGTVIYGDKASKGALVVKPGGKLMAEGTEAQPIVFTSMQAPGARDKGDWGGVILLGNARTNAVRQSIEGISPAVYFGGTSDADNSGSLKYVRIEYAGIALSPNNEINGLTFGGVGSGTTIEHIQVSYSGDDAFEWFGGSVNCKWLVTQGTWDDDYDTDNGFSGKVQFCVAVRERFLADQSGSNGFESDNDASGDTKTPQTSAVFSNMTIIGPRVDSTTAISGNFQHGAQLRRNSAMSLFNSVIAGFPYGVNIDGAAALANYTSGTGVLANNILLSTGLKNGSGQAKLTPFVGGNGNDVNAVASLWQASNLLVVGVTVDPSVGVSRALFEAVTSPYKADPNFALTAGTAAAGAVYTDAKLNDAFFDKTPAYRGAFGATDWTDSWTDFTPNATVR